MAGYEIRSWQNLCKSEINNTEPFIAPLCQSITNHYIRQYTTTNFTLIIILTTKKLDERLGNEATTTKILQKVVLITSWFLYYEHVDKR